MEMERRIYKRMFFSKEEGPLAIFTLPDQQDKCITAVVMDLSLGGLGLSIKKGEHAITVGDRLILTEIKGPSGLEPVANIRTQIRWVQNYENFNHILFGCEFLNASQMIRDQIQEFINLWAKRNN